MVLRSTSELELVVRSIPHNRNHPQVLHSSGIPDRTLRMPISIS